MDIKNIRYKLHNFLIFSLFFISTTISGQNVNAGDYFDFEITTNTENRNVSITATPKFSPGASGLDMQWKLESALPSAYSAASTSASAPYTWNITAPSDNLFSIKVTDPIIGLSEFHNVYVQTSPTDDFKYELTLDSTSLNVQMLPLSEVFNNGTRFLSNATLQKRVPPAPFSTVPSSYSYTTPPGSYDLSWDTSLSADQNHNLQVTSSNLDNATQTVSSAFSTASINVSTYTETVPVAPDPGFGDSVLAFTFVEDAGDLNVTVDYSGGITVQDVLLEWQRPSDGGFSVLDGPLTINSAMPSRTWSHTSITDLQDLTSGTYNFKVTLNVNDSGVIYPISTESNVIVKGDPLSFQLVEENFGEVGVFVMANESSVTSVDLQIKGPAEGTDPDTYRAVRTAGPDPDSTAAENYFRWGTLQVNDTAASEADLALNILGDLQGGTYTLQARADVPDPVTGSLIEVIKEFEVIVGGTRLQYRYVQQGDAPNAAVGIEIWYESADVADASSYLNDISYTISGPSFGTPYQMRPDNESRYLWGVLNAAGNIDEIALDFDANGDGDKLDILPGVDTQLQNLAAGIYSIDVVADIFDTDIGSDTVEQTFEFEVFANAADAPGLSCEDEQALSGNIVQHFRINVSVINDPGTNLISSSDDKNDIGIRLEVDQNFIDVTQVQNITLSFGEDPGTPSTIGTINGPIEKWVWGPKVSGYNNGGTPILDPDSVSTTAPAMTNLDANKTFKATITFSYQGNNYEMVEKINTDGSFGDRMGKDPSLIGAAVDPCAP